MVSKIKDYEFQAQCVEYLIDKTIETNSKQVITVKAPTGAGKTVILIKYVDQFLIDLKHADEKEHKKMLGVSNYQVLRNLRSLSKKDLTIRIPLIRNFNDGEDNLRKSIAIAKELNVKIDLLPFHNYGAVKYRALGMKYEYENEPAYSDEELEKCRAIVRREGLLLE